MEAVSRIFADRDIPLEVDESASLPVLTAVACPYPDLAEHDRGICALERMMFSELIGTGLRLTDCRLDGDDCCRFEPRGDALKEPETAVQ
jgi:DeoR family suf operon transcriptional repressor